jgi:hypothetical protein
MGGIENRPERSGLSDKGQPKNNESERLEEKFELANDETRKSLTRGQARVKEKKVQKNGRGRGRTGKFPFKRKADRGE